MSLRRAVAGIVFAASLMLPTISSASTPSFDCGKATTPDELAICSDDRLAELDRLYARDFAIMKARNRKEALESAASFLKYRKLCGNDRYCIMEQMESLPGGTATPTWLDDAFKVRYAREAAKDDLSAKSLSAIGVTGSFTTSSKGVQATLQTIDGLDTDRATAAAVFTPADMREYCERDPGGETTQYGGKLTVKGCVDTELRAVRSTRVISKANCYTKAVTYNGERWTINAFTKDGITWKAPSEMMEPSSMTSPYDAQFVLLCPNTHARLRAQAQSVETVSNPQTKQLVQSVDDATASIREALARDLSTILTGNDKAGDDRRYMTPDFYKRFDAGAQGFDADWYLGTQDTTIFKLKDVTSIPLDEAHSIVTATFSMEGSSKPYKCAYHMLKVGGRWLVDDVDYLTNGTSARRLLADNP